MFGYLTPDDQFPKQQDVLVQQDQELLVRLNVAPIVQQEYDQQPLQQWQVSYDEVNVSVIWPIPTFVKPSSAMAAVLNVSKRQRYWIPKASMMDTQGIELIQYAPGTIRNWDTDADQQLLQALPFDSDSQEEREISNMVLPASAYDTDADQQRLQDSYQLDRELSDPTEERIFTGILDYTWDDSAEQSILQPDYYKDHLTDEGVEKINIPPQFYGTDADHQLPKEPYLLDRDVLDLGVEKIILIPLVDFTWDNDVEQQWFTPLPFSSDTVMDEGVELITPPPIVTDFTWDNDENQFPQPGRYQDAYDGIDIIDIFSSTPVCLGTGSSSSFIFATGSAISETEDEGTVAGAAQFSPEGVLTIPGGVVFLNSTDALLMEDGVSRFLLEDGSGIILLEE